MTKEVNQQFVLNSQHTIIGGRHEKKKKRKHPKNFNKT